MKPMRPPFRAGYERISDTRTVPTKQSPPNQRRASLWGLTRVTTFVRQGNDSCFKSAGLGYLSFRWTGT